MFLAACTLAFLQAAAATSAGDVGLQRANALLASADYAGAREAYEQILETQPSSPAAQEGEVLASEKLALAARTAHDNNAALGDLLRAAKFAPEQPRLLYDLGVLEDQMALYQEAEATVLHLQTLAPADSKTLYLLSRVKLDRGQLPEAENAMHAYLQANPDDATAYYGLGRILQLRMDNAGAKTAFEKSIALKPEQTESHYQLADIALKAGQFTEAINEAGKVLARDPHHGGALTDVGIALFRQHTYEKAADALQQAVTAAPKYQPAHYYLGLTLARLGRKEASDRELAVATRMAADQNAGEAQRVHLRP